VVTTTVRLRDVKTGKETLHFVGQEGRLEHAVLSPDGKMLATANGDRTVRIWDLKTGKTLKEREFRFGPLRLCYSPDGTTLFSSISTGGVFAWDLTTDKLDELIVSEAGFTPRAPVEYRMVLVEKIGKGRMATLDDHNRQTRVWEGKGEKWVPSAPIQAIRPDEQSTLYLSPDEYNFANAYWKEVALVETGTGETRFRCEVDTPWYKCAFSPSGDLLAVGSGNTVKIWKVRSPEADGIDAARLSLNELDSLWKDLSGNDAQKAFRAVCILSAAPKVAIPLIKDCLKIAMILQSGSVDKRLPALLATLDDDNFDAREKASAELRIFGRLAEPALKQAAESKSAEVRRRAKILLTRFEDPRCSEYRQSLRSAEVLSHIDSQEARELLKAIRTTRNGLPN
jgi:hypothetical protein